MRRRRPKKPEAYPERSRIHPYVTARRRRQLDQWVADQGVSESQAIDDAIGVLCETRGGEASVLFQRLDHMSRQLEPLSSLAGRSKFIEQQLEALGLSLALFLRVWVHSTPALSDEQQRALQPIGVARHRHLVAALGKGLLSGRTLLDELPEDVRLELRARAHEQGVAAPHRSPSPGAPPVPPRTSP